MRALMRGRFRDWIVAADGTRTERGWESNLITYRALDLFARLLANEPGLNGALYWAVGEGDSAWDVNAPEGDARITRLHHEIYRKALDPATDIRYDAETRTIHLKIRFEANEAVGTLREFGIFGGNATAAPNTGYLVNYKKHAKIEKQPGEVLEREGDWRLGTGES